MTVSKRRITVPERHAATVAAIAQRVVDRYPKVEAVAAALAPPLLASAASRNGGRSSDHSDPTALTALGHPGYDELREAIEAWLEQGKWIEDRQLSYLREHPELAALKADSLKGLCHIGGCDFDAVRRGMCWHHYQAELDAEKSVDQGDHTSTTPSAIVPDSFDTSDQVEPQLPASASIWCHTCRLDIPVPAGVDPRVFLTDHTEGCAA